MTKELGMLLEELEIYVVEDSNVHFLATGGYDSIEVVRFEIVRFTESSAYILRVKTYEEFEEGNALYFTFENAELLVDFLEENYR